MVILQVCAFAAPAPGNFISSLIGLENALESKGIKTIYAFPKRAKDKKWCKEIQKKTKVYFLPEMRARFRVETYKIFKVIYKENDVGIVHSHFELYDIPATVTAPKNIKVFWHLHDALLDIYSKCSLSRKILMKIQYGYMSKKAILLSVSQEHALFAAKLGFPKQNIKYFPNGINTSRISIEEIDKSNNKRYMLLFGWEVYRKGVDILVGATKNISMDIKIKIVGQEECKKYLSQQKISSVIEFSEPVSDINELYKETAVFLHISRAEGLSYALLEAIYAGLPVVCSDIPENLFAKIFKNIIWIQSGNVEELKDALELATNSIYEIKHEDIEYNRELIRKEYSISSWINRMQEYYME